MAWKQELENSRNKVELQDRALAQKWAKKHVEMEFDQDESGNTSRIVIVRKPTQ